MTPSDPLAVRTRNRRRAAAALRPVSVAWWRVILATAASVVAGIAAQLAFADWTLAAALNVAVALVAIGLALVPFREARLRAASEVQVEHLWLEREDWKLFTGTSMPRRLSGIERWLLDHPDARHGRAAALLAVGRLDEAAAELERRPPANASEAWERELLRQQLRLQAGERPDLAVLREGLPALSTEQRRHRTLCLAWLAAQDAVEAGGDPIVFLAAGRDPRGSVRLRSRWFFAPVPCFLVAVYPAILGLLVRWALA